MNRRWLYLPVEVKDREFVAKIFLACVAASRDFGVFIGRNGLNIGKDYPCGIYFDKCLSTHKLGFHRYQVQELGNKLVSLDEEGLLLYPEAAFIESRLSVEALDLSSLVFTWGDNQRDLIVKHFSDVCAKVQSVGSPRMDVWRSELSVLYEEQVRHIKARFGKVILIVSNFGGQFSETDVEGPDTHQVSEMSNGAQAGITRFVEYSRHVREGFLDAIPALAESFPQHSIVIRPHVGDKEEFWQEKAVGFAPNVHVVREFSVSPWLVAADLMLHNSCTTSIEAWVGNIPAIAYSEPFPGEEDFQMFPLTNSVSMVCSSRAELINSVREVVSSGKRNKLVSSEIADYFMTIPSAGYSSEAIVSCLEALDIDKVTFIPEDYNLSTKIRERLSLARTRFSDFMKNNEYGYSYRKKKNPGMSYEEVIRVIDKLKSVRPMFAGIETKQVARDTFCIFKPAPNISDS